jgi:hypothetical protein
MKNMVLTDNHRTRSAGHAMLVLQQAQAEVRKLIAGPGCTGEIEACLAETRENAREQ